MNHNKLSSYFTEYTAFWIKEHELKLHSGYTVAMSNIGILVLTNQEKF